jgi:hypothetical protein
LQLLVKNKTCNGRREKGLSILKGFFFFFRWTILPLGVLEDDSWLQKFLSNAQISSALAFFVSSNRIHKTALPQPSSISRNFEQHPQNEFAFAAQKHRNPRYKSCKNRKKKKTLPVGEQNSKTLKKHRVVLLPCSKSDKMLSSRV